MQPPRVDAEMTFLAMPCNHCQGTGKAPSSTPGIVLPGKCPQCQGTGILLEVQFIPPIYLPKYGWTIRGAIARVEAKGDLPGPKRFF